MSKESGFERQRPFSETLEQLGALFRPADKPFDSKAYNEASCRLNQKYAALEDRLFRAMLTTPARDEDDYPERIELFGRVALDEFQRLIASAKQGSFGIPSQDNIKNLDKELETIEENLRNECILLEQYWNLKKDGTGLIDAEILDRVARLGDFARKFSGQGLEDFFWLLFPELADHQSKASAALRAGEGVKISLPTHAPTAWKDDKQPGETPPAFIKRVYGEWLGKGLDRAHIRNLDRPLYVALDNWLRQHDMPLDVDLPTRKEQNSRWVERIEAEGLGAVIRPGSPAEIAKEAQRLAAAQRRRSR
jgi:hypothetical protein